MVLAVLQNPVVVQIVAMYLAAQPVLATAQLVAMYLAAQPVLATAQLVAMYLATQPVLATVQFVQTDDLTNLFQELPVLECALIQLEVSQLRQQHEAGS